MRDDPRRDQVEHEPADRYGRRGRSLKGVPFVRGTPSLPQQLRAAAKAAGIAGHIGFTLNAARQGQGQGQGCALYPQGSTSISTAIDPAPQKRVATLMIGE